MKPDYDTTLARIAGNIAAGLVSKADQNGSGINGVGALKDWMDSVALLSVGLAVLIVAKVKNLEPSPSSPQKEEA